MLETRMVAGPESSKAAAAFAAYVDLGPERSLAKLAHLLWGDAVKTTSKRRQLSTWSAKYAWVARAAEADALARERARVTQAERQAADAQHEAEREAQRRHEREVMDDERAPLMRAAWRKTLNQINGKLDSGDTKGLVGLVSLLGQTMAEERLARGPVPIEQHIDLTSNGEKINDVTAIADEVERRIARLAALFRPPHVPGEPASGDDAEPAVSLELLGTS